MPKADAGDLSQVLSRLDAMATRMDALEVGGGSKNPIKSDAKKSDDDDDDKKKDAEEEEEEKKEEKADEEEEEEEKKPPLADKKKDAKKDGEEESAKIPPIASQDKKKDALPPQFAKKDKKSDDDDDDDDKKKDSRADAELASLREHVEGQSREIARLTGLMKPRSDEEHAEMAEIQAKADSVFMGFGKKAPRPLEGEKSLSYRMRLATYLKPHSKRWAKVKFSALGEEAFGIAEEDVYNDAAQAAHHPVDIPEGELREVTREDPRSGLRTTYFYGDSFIRSMGMPCRKVKGGPNGIRTDFRTHS
jgi:hypothetical protein